jgi:neutral ceramidase
MSRRPTPLLAALALLAACASSERVAGTLPAPVPRAGTGQARAGAARADLTPMPGMPMGGFAIVGRTSRGHWTRLRARAVYLEDADGHGLALVACDLWSVPGGLSDRVAELLAARPETRHLGRGSLVLGASHTHHSPGNFSTSAIYNAYASPLAGFDRGLFEFLARRIAGAVAEAVTAARPATLRVGVLALTGVSRNRSFDAFALDRDRDEILAHNAALSPGRPDAYRAIDPTLTVLRADAADAPGEPIAVAAFFAVHATVMGPASEVYSSDLFGIAETLAERRLGAGIARPPVVALLNGAEGDVSPDWDEQDRRNTLRLGTRLAGGIVAAATAAAEPVGGPLVRAFDPAVRLAGATFTDAGGVPHRTADDAAMGAAAVGGAEDGRTAFFHAGWREGVRGLRLPGQGPKAPLLNPFGLEPPPWLGRLLRRLATPPPGPVALPLAVYRMGPLAIATLPGEFTMALGRRIATGVRAAAGDPPHVVLVGLAGEYRSYFTTPEEYDLQHYEGASTLYGPEAGPLVAQALAKLAGRLDEAPAEPARAYAYDAGAARRFGPADAGAPPPFADDGLEDVLEDLETGLAVRSFPCAEWDDAAPAWDGRVTPSVGVETQAGEAWAPLVVDGVAETDDGFHFVTVVHGVDGGRTHWVAYWMPPPGAGEAVPLRFRVETLAGTVVHSPPFALGGPTRTGCAAAG